MTSQNVSVKKASMRPLHNAHEVQNYSLAESRQGVSSPFKAKATRHVDLTVSRDKNEKSGFKTIIASKRSGKLA